MCTESNTGKTAVSATVALIVSMLFLIFGVVAVCVHIPVTVGIVLFVIAAVLCALGYRATQAGKQRGRRLVSIAAIASVAALILSIIGGVTGTTSASSSSPSASPADEECAAITWPTAGVGSQIAPIEGKQGHVRSESAQYFSVKLCNVTPAEFEDYIQTLQDAGFSEPNTTTSVSFTGMNDAGDKVDVYRYPNDNEISISIYSAQYLAEHESDGTTKDDRQKGETEKKDEEDKRIAEEQK